jgi:hypothetical protein
MQSIDDIPSEVLDLILSEVDTHSLCSFGATSNQYHIQLQKKIDLSLCDSVYYGYIALPPISENLPLIRRVQKYWPEFDPTRQDNDHLQHEQEDEQVYEGEVDDDGYFDYESEDEPVGYYDVYSGLDANEHIVGGFDLDGYFDE